MGLGLEGRFDFTFAGEAVTEQEEKNQKKIQLCMNLLMNPLVASNPGNLWKITDMLAQAYGENNLEGIITKPKEAYLFSVEEALERIMSGETDIQPQPGIDTNSYIMRIGFFMRSETFQNLPPDQSQAVQDLLRRVSMMASAERLAQTDMMHIQHGMAAQHAAMNQPGQPGMPGQPQIAGNPGQGGPSGRPLQ